MTDNASNTRAADLSSVTEQSATWYQWVRTEVVERRHIDFDLTDKRGRAIGMSVTITRETAVRQDGPTPSWWAPDSDASEGDTRLVVRMHPTRAGKRFGSLQREHVVPAPKVEAHVSKKVESSRKRYVRKIAKGQV